jgi:hypothetical protein
MRTTLAVALTTTALLAGRAHADPYIFSMSVANAVGSLNGVPFSSPMIITLTGEAVPLPGSGPGHGRIRYAATNPTIYITTMGTYTLLGSTSFRVWENDGRVDFEYDTPSGNRILLASDTGFSQLINWNGIDDFGPLTAPSTIAGWFPGREPLVQTTGGVMYVNTAGGVGTTFNLRIDGVPGPASSLALAAVLGFVRRRARR